MLPCHGRGRGFESRPDRSPHSPSEGGAFIFSEPLSTKLPPIMSRTPLTSKQRAHLRSLSHDLDPVVRVGKDGLTEAVVNATNEAFNTRELVKVRVLDAATEEIREVGETLVEQIDDAMLVQVIGHIAILFRPDADDPAIELP